MKITAAILALLCSIAAFAGKNTAFETVPAEGNLTPQKELTRLQITPVSHDKSKFYRISMQIKAKQTGVISSTTTVGKKNSWESICVPNTGWNTVYRYVSPGEKWIYKVNVKRKEAAFCVRDIKVEELDDNNLTSNLLPPLDNAGWYSAWGKKKAKIGLEKYDESPFGENILTAEIDKGTGNPATLAIPAVPGRTLVLEIWIKGEPEEPWTATISRRGTKVLPVTKEWRRREIRFNIKPQAAPDVASLVFWKPKNQRKLTCSIARVKAYYEK